MLFRYIPQQEELKSDELGTYTTYGVKVFENESEVKYISDVSLDKHFVSELCRKCTEGQLEPIHLMDIIEDNI